MRMLPTTRKVALTGVHPTQTRRQQAMLRRPPMFRRQLLLTATRRITHNKDSKHRKHRQQRRRKQTWPSGFSLQQLSNKLRYSSNSNKRFSPRPSNRPNRRMLSILTPTSISISISRLLRKVLTRDKPATSQLATHRLYKTFFGRLEMDRGAEGGFLNMGSCFPYILYVFCNFTVVITRAVGISTGVCFALLR